MWQKTLFMDFLTLGFSFFSFQLKYNLAMFVSAFAIFSSCYEKLPLDRPSASGVCFEHNKEQNIRKSEEEIANIDRLERRIEMLCEVNACFQFTKYTALSRPF